MSITLSALQKQRYDTAANWTAANPTLLAGELGIESDTEKIKIGDGSTAWNVLAYLPGSEISAHPIATADVADSAITSAKIADGTIVNADISASAEIAVSKLQDGAARQLLQTDAAGTGVEWASNIDVPGTLDVTNAATFDNNVTIQGDLTVNGTTTTIDTTTLVVEDKNIEMGAVATPTDTTADGGGITLKGATDKTINWINATDAWTFSEHVNIASGKEYRIAGTSVLSATTLGAGVTGSSLTSVGTISSGVWNGTAINATYLDSSVVTTADTGTVTSTMIHDGTIVNADINASAAIADTKLSTISTAGKVSNSATTATDANTANAIVTRDASGNFSAGTISAALSGNATSATSAGSATTAGSLTAARTIELTGDITGSVSTDLSGTASIATSVAAGVIVNADVSATAAIAGTKISAAFGDQDLTVDTDRLFVDVSEDRVGINCTPEVTLDINATDAVALPHGTELERPSDGGTPANLTGYIRFNTDTSQFEGHNGTAWSSVGGGAQGGGSDQVFFENDQTVNDDYEISANKNAMSAGPITIDAGATVTIPSGSRWVIV